MDRKFLMTGVANQPNTPDAHVRVAACLMRSIVESDSYLELLPRRTNIHTGSG